MNILRNVGSGLVKMFVGDTGLAIGILAVVTLTGLLRASVTVPRLFAGALLFVGCIVVLVRSVVLHARHRRDR